MPKEGINIRPRMILAVLALVAVFVGWGVDHQISAGKIERNTEFREDNKDLSLEINNIKRDIGDLRKDYKEARIEINGQFKEQEDHFNEQKGLLNILINRTGSQ